MAPEQASGVSRHIVPAADVYALGVILYECLTGRPPFKAATALDTLRQVIAEEPVAPAQLQSKTPRDLETICLKCLRKEPPRRYASAQELADDLGRFLGGEPIRARPVGRLEKALKWVKRRPAAAALWGVGLLALVLGAAGGLWLERQALQRQAEADRRQAALRQGVEDTLVEVGRLQERDRWDEARAVLRQAAKRLGDSGPADLRRRVEKSLADLLLVGRLDAVRLKAATLPAGEFDYRGADRDYARAFRRTPLGRQGQGVRASAAWVKESAVRKRLVAALDDWALVTQQHWRRAWLLAVALQADPDPWRDRFRQPALWQDRAALERLARQAKVGMLSPQLLTALGSALRKTGANAVPLLMAAQGRFPQDFWLNFDLGDALWEAKKPGKAIGYYRAALALRPHTSAVYNNLGLALQDKGRLEEASACFQKAIALDSKNALAQNYLKECARLLTLAPKLPALLRGELRPTSSAERIDYARLCLSRQLYRAAARLFAEAFVADAKLADNLQTGHRYAAACAAALAAAGLGKDSGKLDAKERARWRKQALDWLRADLALWTKLLASGKPQDRTLVEQQMRHWQGYADLGAIRDASALAKLPQEEQETCRRLWADVAALLQRASSRK
jgi:serine/threonine-protein kinase